MTINNFQIPTNLKARPSYLEQLRPFIGQQLIKVLTGQRRVGKSYLLYQLIEHIVAQEEGAAIIYINKEDLTFASLKEAEDLHAYVMAHKAEGQKTYVFIDEIQDIANFEAALRSLLLHPDLDLYCTGSNANLLSSDIAGQLSGRYIAIEVHSLSYLEFLDFHNLDNTDTAVMSYLKYGGLPYLKHLELKDEQVFDYLKNIYQSIAYRDIINRFAIRNVSFLEQLVQFLASQTGSLFSANKISQFLKSQQVQMAPNQVQQYIDHLVSAYLIHKVERYDVIGKRLFEVGAKYYFENLGIRNGIWGFRPEDLGKIMENVVYKHLLFMGYTVKVGVLADKEIDFVAERNSEKLYVQVALSITAPETLEREFGNLAQIPDNYPKWVITLDAFEGNSYNGIQALSLRTFLTNPSNAHAPNNVV